VSCLTKLLQSKRTYFIAGDFNLPNIDWFTCVAPDDGVHDIIFQLLVDNNLTQMITVPTQLNNILDIFLTNLPSDCVLCDPLGASDHDSIILDITLPRSVKGRVYQSLTTNCNAFILWNPTSIARVQALILSYNWSYLFTATSTPEKVWTFISSTNFISSKTRITHSNNNKTHSTAIRDHDLKRLFSLKAAIWRQIRRSVPGSTPAINHHKRYKATIVRIQVTILNL